MVSETQSCDLPSAIADGTDSNMRIMADGTDFGTLEDELEAQSRISAEIKAMSQDLAEIKLGSKRMLHQLEILTSQMENIANSMRSLAEEPTEVSGTSTTSSGPNISSANRTRFDTDVNLDTIETSLSYATRVSLKNEAQHVFDKMPHPIPGAEIEIEQDLLFSNGENREYTTTNLFDEMSESVPIGVNENQKVLLFSNEGQSEEIIKEECHGCETEGQYDSTMELKKDSTPNDQIYSWLEDGIYLVVRDAHHSLFESKYTNEMESQFISYGNISFEDKCLWKSFDNAGILESHLSSIMTIPHECGMVYTYGIGSTLLCDCVHGSSFLTHSSLDEGVIFLFDPGGSYNNGKRMDVISQVEGVELSKELGYDLLHRFTLFQNTWGLV